MLFKDRHLIRVAVVMWGSVRRITAAPTGRQLSSEQATQDTGLYYILNTLFCVLNVPGGSWPGCAALIFVLSVCLWCGASSWSLIITTTSDFLWHDLLNAALPWRLSGRVQVQISCKTSRESGKSTVCEPSCSHTEHCAVRWDQPQIYHQSSQEFVENVLLIPLRGRRQRAPGSCCWSSNSSSISQLSD